jgi:hypothetical protein
VTSPNTLAQGVIDSAPAADRVDVTLIGFDTQQRFNDCRYTPRGATEPADGDTCLVAFDDQGDAWVIAFDPT